MRTTQANSHGARGSKHEPQEMTACNNGLEHTRSCEPCQSFKLESHFANLRIFEGFYAGRKKTTSRSFKPAKLKILSLPKFEIVGFEIVRNQREQCLSLWFKHLNLPVRGHSVSLMTTTSLRSETEATVENSPRASMVKSTVTEQELGAFSQMSDR